ncbi:hypothetical protein FACS1894140_1580 [Spirochaetia bacterium]|nr:hypothetical protein FACS1894140_1580 [Spirochaetia bacterium]
MQTVLGKKTGNTLSFTPPPCNPALNIGRHWRAIVLAGALILAFSGCSRSNAPSPVPAQALAAESPAPTTAQPAAIPAQTPPAPQAEPATSAAAEIPTPVPAAPAAPKYAIGAEGPGGGTVFTVSNGKGKEVGPAIPNGIIQEKDTRFTITVIGGMNPQNTRYKYNGNSNWRFATIQELRSIYTNLQKPGIKHIGDGWVFSITPDSQAISGFPGYSMYYAGSGDTFWYFGFTTGEAKTTDQLNKEYGDAAWNNQFQLLVRDF